MPKTSTLKGLSKNVGRDRDGRGPSRAPHVPEGNPSRISEGTGGDPAMCPRPDPGMSVLLDRPSGVELPAGAVERLPAVALLHDRLEVLAPGEAVLHGILDHRADHAAGEVGRR